MDIRQGCLCRCRSAGNPFFQPMHNLPWGVFVNWHPHPAHPSPDSQFLHKPTNQVDQRTASLFLWAWAGFRSMWMPLCERGVSLMPCHGRYPIRHHLLAWVMLLNSASLYDTEGQWFNQWLAMLSPRFSFWPDHKLDARKPAAWTVPFAPDGSVAWKYRGGLPEVAVALHVWPVSQFPEIVTEELHWIFARSEEIYQSRRRDFLVQVPTTVYAFAMTRTRRMAHSGRVSSKVVAASFR